MRKIVLLFAAAVAALSCSQKWNDLVHEEVPAEITAFEVEEQSSVKISKSTRLVTVSVPAETDFSRLTVKAFSVTEGADCSHTFQPGESVDLSDTLKITLTTYDEYVWKIIATEEKKAEPEPKDGPQLYNLSFDLWSPDPDLAALNIFTPYGEDATDEEKVVWGNADRTLAALGFPTVSPEREFLAVEGEGKAALRLQTQGIEALRKLAAGSLFTGQVGKIDIWAMTAELLWGVPFTERPAALEGYVCYHPETIDYAEEPYADMKGKPDKGAVLIFLSDHEGQFVVKPPENLVDYENDPTIIGYGKILFEKDMTEYEKFHVDITYRSDRTPTMITIVTTSSAYGDYFTGASGSVIYFDELKLLY